MVSVVELVDRIYRGPVVWGVSDCCTRACDVFAALHGVDPMAPLRGQYGSQAEALALIRARGGWRRMCNDLADVAGLVRGRGDVGALALVRWSGSIALAVGVRGGWAAPDGSGSVIVPSAIERWSHG